MTSVAVNADAGSAVAPPPLQPPLSRQMSVQTDALGPLDSMGVPDAIFLSDKTEADQCLITITGAYIRVCPPNALYSLPPSHATLALHD